MWRRRHSRVASAAGDSIMLAGTKLHRQQYVYAFSPCAASRLEPAAASSQTQGLARGQAQDPLPRPRARTPLAGNPVHRPERTVGRLVPTHYGQSNLTDETIDYFVGHTLSRTLTCWSNRSGGRCSSRKPPADHDDAPDHAQSRRHHARVRRPPARDTRQCSTAICTPPTRATRPRAASTRCCCAIPASTAIIHHRLAHELYHLGVPLLARHRSPSWRIRPTGIDIHPGAHIGASFFIDHGTGVVIGETAVIGERVRLYQARDAGRQALSGRRATGSLHKGLAAPSRSSKTTW